MKQAEQTLESMSQALYYNRWTLKKFDSYLQGKILEVGCGIGTFSQVLEKFGTVYAIDIEEKYIKELKDNYQSNGLKFGFGDIENNKFFFKNQKFDTVICLNVLEHIKDDQTALENMADLLTTQGYLILLVPAHNFLYGTVDHSIGHYRRYEKVELMKLLSNSNLEIINIKRINFLGAIGWFIAGKVFHDKVVKNSSIKFFNLIAPLFLSLEDIIEPPIGTSLLVIAKRQ